MLLGQKAASLKMSCIIIRIRPSVFEGGGIIPSALGPLLFEYATVLLGLNGPKFQNLSCIFHVNMKVIAELVTYSVVMVTKSYLGLVSVQDSSNLPQLE